MIDFRYHLVSLISVFLALAVGVVLGAGPLQNSLGTALNDQVTALRENRNATQAKLEQTETAVNERDSYITQAATSLLPGTLASKNVAMVLLPDAKAEDADTLAQTLRDSIQGKQWMCGFPDKLVVAKVGGYVVSFYGDQDLVNTFRDKLSAAWAGTEIVFDEAIQ